MEHFIAYHSVHRMGYEYDSPGQLFFLSKKLGLLRKAIGNSVWVVQGKLNGKKTDYVLCGVYIADGVESEGPSSDEYVIRGKQGVDFSPPIPLNDEIWFPQLLKTQSNFSLGFNRLSDQSVVSALLSILDENAHQDDWFSVQDYEAALHAISDTMPALHRRMLIAHAEAADNILSVRQLAAAGGYDKPHATYSQYGRLGRAIAVALGVKETWKVWTKFIGQDTRAENGELLWQMHSELVDALANLGWIDAERGKNAIADLDDACEILELIDDTERDALIQARLGQGIYRTDLLKIWGGCAVTGVTEPAVLRASHVKPWRNSSNAERLDPNNGLLLAAHLDALFDCGLITFNADGVIVISPLLAKEDALVLGVHEQMKIGALHPKLLDYLKHHRDNVFRK